MPDWDSWMMVALGLGAAVYSGVKAWQSLREQGVRAAIGMAILAVGALIVPILFGLFRT